MNEAPPRFAWFERPDGGRLRWAWWRPAAAPVGTVVLLGGRCEYLRKYQELAEDWLGRGWQVFSLEWRGQGLSSRFLAETERGHVPDFAILATDLADWLAAAVEPNQVGPVVLFAHSMGGLVALMLLRAQPARFAAAVLSAPMVAIETKPWPRWLARLLAGAATVLGFGPRYAFGQGDYDPAVDGRFTDNPVTSDPARFDAIHDGFRRKPRLRVGGVTFGWLDAAFRAQAQVMRPGALAGLTWPVLLLIAPGDRLIPLADLSRLAEALPAVTVCHYPEARHDLMAECDAVRQQVWADLDRFLARVLRNQA